MRIVRIDARLLTDWDAFHDVFSQTFGFPEFYGQNMNAWIDCLGSLDEPSAGMTTIHVSPGEVLVLALEQLDDLAARRPALLHQLILGVAAVNRRCIEQGRPPVLVLA